MVVKKYAAKAREGTEWNAEERAGIKARSYVIEQLMNSGALRTTSGTEKNAEGVEERWVYCDIRAETSEDGSNG